MIKRLGLALLVAIWPLCWTPATAQTNTSAYTVSTCGTPPSGFGPTGSYAANGWYPVTQNTNGALCTSAAANVTQNVLSPDSSVTTGTITSTQSVTFTPASGGYGTFAYAISGTWAGLIVVEGSVDCVNFTATTAVPLNSTAAGAFTGNSIGQGSMAGLCALRFRGNTVTSGTATVTLRGAASATAVMQDNLPWSVYLTQSNGSALTSSTPVPVQTQPIGVTTTNASGTVTLGGTFQSVLAANSARRGCLIQNPSTATEVLYVFFGANASATTSNSIMLTAGSSVNCASDGVVLTDNVSVTGATTSHAFIAMSQ